MSGGENLWWDYWYFHLPNYALAVVMYTMVGRFTLGLLLRPDSPNYIYRWFRRLTQPLMAPVRFISPSYINDKYVPLVGACWMAAARVVFYIAMFNAGWAPKMSGVAG